MPIISKENECSELAEYDFVREERNATDLVLLGQLANATVVKLSQQEKPDILPIFLTKMSDGRSERIVIYSWEELQHDIQKKEPTELFFVGFFGTKSPNRTAETNQAIDDADKILVPSLTGIDGLLAYVSQELPDGNWANLVLCRDASTKDHFYEDTFHMHVARNISPVFYSSLRLHNGRATAGNSTISDLFLTKTNYLLFEGEAQPKRCTRRYTLLQ